MADPDETLVHGLAAKPNHLNPVAAVVARNMREARLARKWSTQDLANRLREAGVVMPRSVLTNVENARREDVTVDEHWQGSPEQGYRTCINCYTDTAVAAVEPLIRADERAKASVRFALFRRRIKALESLSTCYRLGSHPGEKLLRELDATRAALLGDDEKEAAP